MQKRADVCAGNILQARNKFSSLGLMPTSQSYQFIFIQIMFRALKFLDVSDCLVLVSQIEKIVMRSQFIDE